ncbi:MAG TPA: helicase C-terminal domain-containing protein [Longimicrobiaceae bacterium]|nr:helicase C-terminal domain-containing protein [Longimicrobiaceae bacterium]
MGERDLRLESHAAERVRAEISRAAGNEVCFVASVDDEGRLSEPRVVARGNASAVLAAIRTFRPGQVVLHNHPSGDLTPSHPDLAIAERLWAEGLGFAITNNRADDLYVVVAPAPPRTLDPIDPHGLEADLAPGGVLSRAHPGYEDRPDQRALAATIAELYHRGGIAVAEAGTGIGKSVAYLLPAIRWAVQNRERTVVSTNTINLQEQLVRKDLPFLSRALDVPLRFALVKGRQNYVSIRRAKLAAISAASLFPDSKESELKAIVEWTEQTRDGSLSDLPFRPSVEVWDEVVSDSDVCLRARCPHFESCFYQRSRRDAASADILVVNHHLLFSDLAVRQAAGNFSAPAVLPHYQRLVLDEAHNLEETATRHLGARLSRRGYSRLLRRLEHRGKGLLPAFEKALASRPGDLLVRGCLDLIQQRLRPELEGAWKRGSEVFRHAAGLARSEPGGVVRLQSGFAAHPVWREGLEEDLAATIAHLDTLVSGFEMLRERISNDERLAESLEEQLLEVRGAASRLDAAAAAFRTALREEGGEGEVVRWIEFRAAPRFQAADSGDGNVVLASAPLDLAAVLRETLWERIPTAVLTSATLATREGFNFVRQRLGLSDGLDVSEAVYTSPFDFPSQSVLVVPRDLPLPGRDDDPAHAAATERVVLDLAELTDGGIFVLFTSYRALNRLATSIRRGTHASRWPLFVHGEAPRAQLLESFTASGRGILLGTDSFWEGVDVPGHPLRGIVIAKLPFKVPSEPVTSARIEAIEARGENSFLTYMLPHAAIRLKQGFGRLIRSRSDRGAVVILDGRIVTKSYGSYLLESLPPARRIVATWAECRDELRRFYASALAGPPPHVVRSDRD